MSAQSRLGRCQRRVLRFLASLIVVAIVLVAAVLLVRQIPVMQAQESRRVAYAATATHIARPSPTLPVTPATATTMPATAPLPTQEDLHILPTPTAASLQGTLPSGAPTRTASNPVQFQYDLVNFLVVGTDRRGGTSTAYRADVILIVSVNRTTQTVNVLSVPRDLYVYVPGWGMDRVNTAEVHQAQMHISSHPLGLLAETIEYNLGINIHHLVRVDFAGFEAIIDQIGGVPVPVDCPVTGFQLQTVEQETGISVESWEPFTLEPGMHLLNGDLALWYVRQRLDSSDFDRNRRQQILLRALWQQLRASDVVSNLPLFWEQVTGSLDTDLSIDEVLGLIPLVLNLDASRVEGHFIGLDEVDLWHTPSGASVLVMDPVPFQATVARFLTPPLENRLAQEWAWVDVLNASLLPDADQLAAARLQALGIVAIPRGVTAAAPGAVTTLYDHTGRVKGSSLGVIQAAFGIGDSEVITATNADNAVDFTVVIGADYEPCDSSPWRPFDQPE